MSRLATTRIASALLTAQAPLIITSHLGRNIHAVPTLLALSSLLAIPISVTCPSAINVPFSHPYFAGISFLQPGSHTAYLQSADVILVIDSDLPWIPANDRPNENARVFLVDAGDPLKANVGFFHVGAELICKADAELALGQIIESVRVIDAQGVTVGESTLGSHALQKRRQTLEEEHKARIRSMDDAETVFPEVISTSAASFTVPNLMGVLRIAIRAHTSGNGKGILILNEAISNYPAVWMHSRTEIPGSVISSGGSSLGWALGAAVGANIGGKISQEGGNGYELIVAIVGDGSFLFGVPSSAYWMARKYNTVSDVS